MSNEENPQGFVQSKLPWIVGAGALILYLLTLNQWVSLRSITLAGQVAGWEWGLPVQYPLFFTVTYPFRFLPAGTQVVAMNVFAAVCASLTLVLLARSVALLPHDRTHEQRQRERSDFSLLSINLAWVPVVLAVVVCGLQLTFWEHATAVTGEMLDLLFFAYIVRCLLEYRISHNERWLTKLAFTYGLAVTNNWAMIGFFPGFLAALIWIKGIPFFDPGFLIRMVLSGMAGLLLYLLLPIVWMLKGDGEFSFIEVLRANLASQKMMLLDAPGLRNRALLLALTSVLPVFLMGIRWPSSFGDTSVAGAALTNLAFRIIHLFFLAACVWVAFDPKYSPRELGMGIPFLSFYYLAALAIGYYSGYALLVFTTPPRKSWHRENPTSKLINPLVRIAVLAALVAVPAALFVKNFAVIKAEDGSLLKEFAAHTAATLPETPAYIFSDDPFKLSVVRAYLGSVGKNQHVTVDTRALNSPEYHKQLQKRYRERWPFLPEAETESYRVSQVELQKLVSSLVSSNAVIYLHPSFGYFFEAAYLQPNGLTYTLHPYRPEQVLPPPLTQEQIETNQRFWTRPADLIKRVDSIDEKAPADAQYIARFYSRALNTWGVDLQRAQLLPEAGQFFTQAVGLNTNNVSARINREFNQQLQRTGAASAAPPRAGAEPLGSYRTWDELLRDNGMFDQPYYNALFGETMINQGQYRQAAMQFARVIHFQPENFEARLSMAQIYVMGNWTDQALSELERIESDFQNLPVTNQVDLVGLRAAAYFKRRDFNTAEEILQQARQKYPNNAVVEDSLVQLYRSSNRFTNALELLEERLQSSPRNFSVHYQKAELLLNHGQFTEGHLALDRLLALAPKHVPALLLQAFAYIQQKNYERALPSIDRVLLEDSSNVQALMYRGIVYMELKDYTKARKAFDDILTMQPRNIPALRNRAILNLLAQRWSDAREDYERLNELTPRSHAVLYGLAEVAYNQGNFDEAAKLYKDYLKFAPAESSGELAEERKKVEARLAELQSRK